MRTTEGVRLFDKPFDRLRADSGEALGVKLDYSKLSSAAIGLQLLNHR